MPINLAKVVLHDPEINRIWRESNMSIRQFVESREGILKEYVAISRRLANAV